MGPVEQSILSTLIYADIFDYPLTRSQLWRFLASDKKIKRSDFERKLLSLYRRVKTKQRFYFLAGREHIVSLRIDHKKHSNRKGFLAKEIARIIFRIPTVQLIGVSGALAMANCGEKDDIDFFVITKKNSLWVTRFFVLFLLQILGKRRKRGDTTAPDMACVNMFMDESLLTIPKEKQNLYGAHEVVQMNPLHHRSNIYEKFIRTNNWIVDFLPNAFTSKIFRNKEVEKQTVFHFLLSLLLRILNFLAKYPQLWSINRNRTREKISDGILMFHPVDYGEKVLMEYNKRIKNV